MPGNWWDADEVVTPAPGPLTFDVTARRVPAATETPATAPALPAPSASPGSDTSAGNWWSQDEVVRAAPSARSGGVFDKVDAAVRGAADMATFGMADELSAWLASKTGIGGKSGDYEGNLKAQRQMDRYDEEHNFVPRLAGQVAGGVGSAIATGGGNLLPQATTLPGRMAVGAGVGAATGGAYGFGSGEGGAAERGIEAAKGAGIGAVVGPFTEAGVAGGQAVYRRMFPASVAAPAALTQSDHAALSAVGLDPAHIGDDAARSIIGRAQRYGGLSDATLRQAAAEEFNVPLTRGQATQDVGRSAFEEEARAAARGEPAANILRGFDARQAEAVQGAREGIQRDIAGPYTIRNDLSEIGAGITGAVRDEERALNNRVGQAYERAGETGATISADSIRGLPQRVSRVLDDAAIIVDDQLTPATQAALRELNRVADVEGFATSRGVNLGPDANVAGVNLNGFEYVRRRINSLYGGNLSRADRNGLTTVKREFDGWLDQAVDNALISGDESALAALKEARGLRAEYGRKFEKADRFDDSGGLIQRILRQDVTPGEVVNMLYGLNKVGEKGSSARLAKDLREIMGTDSEGWSAIRQGAFARLTLAPEGAAQPSPKVVRERIMRFVNGPDGSAMSRILYSQDELDTMRRFANVVQFLVPPARSTNPSGSGFAMQRRAEGMLSKLVGMLGFAGTGSATAGAAAAGAVKAASAGNNIRKAVQATQPLRLAPPSPPVLGAAAGELGAAYGAPRLPDFVRR